MPLPESCLVLQPDLRRQPPVAPWQKMSWRARSSAATLLILSEPTPTQESGGVSKIVLILHGCSIACPKVLLSLCAFLRDWLEC